MGTPSKTVVAVKCDMGKPRMDLLPPGPLVEVAKVLSYGAEKYAAHNWEKGLEWSRVYAAIQRHLNAFWSGEDKDLETTLPHLAHAVCNGLMLLEYMRSHPELDDRSFKIPQSEGQGNG